MPQIFVLHLKKLNLLSANNLLYLIDGWKINSELNNYCQSVTFYMNNSCSTISFAAKNMRLLKKSLHLFSHIKIFKIWKSHTLFIVKIVLQLLAGFKPYLNFLFLMVSHPY